MPSFRQRGEDYAKKVSSELIEQIKEGVAPWQKPWKPGEQCTPENFSTGKSYTGGNSLYLMSRGIRQGHGDNRWGTYRQIAAAGGQVRKGRKRDAGLVFHGSHPEDREGRAGQAGEGPGRETGLPGRAALLPGGPAVHRVQRRTGRWVGVEAARSATDTRMANASRSGTCDSSQRDDATSTSPEIGPTIGSPRTRWCFRNTISSPPETVTTRRRCMKSGTRPGTRIE